ncbi:hypothetical protein H8E06_00625 [bacterium]|nr:hypothetical protein [bacterium]
MPGFSLNKSTEAFNRAKGVKENQAKASVIAQKAASKAQAITSIPPTLEATIETPPYVPYVPKVQKSSDIALLIGKEGLRVLDETFSSFRADGVIAGGAGFGNFFDPHQPLKPRDAFMNALQNWEFNTAMQNLWAVVFELPPVMQSASGNRQDLSGQSAQNVQTPDSMLKHLGEFRTGEEMNADRASTTLFNPDFHKRAGCLFAQSINLPGEQVNATWVHPHDQSSGGLLGFPILSNRQELRRLNISFRETNFSFLDFIIRPWLILAAHLGLTERQPYLRMGVKTTITIIQYAKAGSALEPIGRGDSGHENKIGLIPRKIWKFKDCVPTNLPPGDYSYGESQIETRGIDFIYSRYTVQAPRNYINHASNLAYEADKIHRKSQPAWAAVRERHASVQAMTQGDVSVDKYENRAVGEKLHAEWNAVLQKTDPTPNVPYGKGLEAAQAMHGQLTGGQKPPVAYPEANKTHAQEQKNAADSRPSNYRLPENKNKEEVHASNQQSFGEARSEPKAVGNKNKEEVHASNQQSFGEARSEPKAVGNKNKEEVHASNQQSFGEAVSPPDATPEKMKAAMHYEEGKNKPFPSAGGGYRWNAGNRGGLFGWLK